MNYDIGPDDPLHAPAGEPLPPEIVETLVQRQTLDQRSMGHSSSTRKREAYEAYDIFRNRVRGLVAMAIFGQQENDTIRQGMLRQITKVRNDALDVTAQVAVVWKNGAERHLGSDGDESDTITTAQELALGKLAKESRFDVFADTINQLAWLVGPQFAVPMVRGGKLTCDVVGPHVYDIVQDVENPLGMPVGLAWHLSSHRIAQSVEHHVFVLDAQTLTRYVTRGPGTTTVADVVEHRMGRLPAALLRFSLPMSGDEWFLTDAQSRLTSGTIDIGVKMARMGMVRKAQCLQLLSVIGRLEFLAKGQTLSNPEAPVAIDTGGKAGGGSVDLKVHDFDTDPKNFIAEILFHVQSMVEPYGGHVQVESGAPEIFGKVVIPPAIQAEHRKRQIPPATDFEVQWWSAAVAMMRAEGHPLARELPGPDEIAERLRLNFGQLTQELEDPTAAQAFEDWQISRGLTSQVRQMQRRLGGASEAEAKSQIERNMLNQAWFNDFAARQNLPTSTDGSTMTAPQANGAMGTPQREENRAQAQGNAGPGSAGNPPDPTQAQ